MKYVNKKASHNFEDYLKSNKTKIIKKSKVPLFDDV